MATGVTSGGLDFRIVVNDGEVKSTLDGFPREFTREVRRAMLMSVIGLEGRVKRKLSGDVLHVRSGSLRRSIFHTVTKHGDKSVTGIVGTPLVYGKTHEFGAVIKPKKPGGFLAIPMRGGSKRAQAMGNRQRAHFANLMAHGASGAFAARLSGARFIFVKQVTIPKRPFMAPSLAEERPAIEARFAAAGRLAVNAAIEKARAKGAK